MFRSFVFVAALLIASPVFAQITVEIDSPTASPIARSFAVQGVALGADVVHVWAFPASGGVFLGAAAANLPDPDRVLSSGRFELTAANAPLGTYPVVVYAHDPVTNTFPASKAVTVTVRRSPFVSSGFGNDGATIAPNMLDDAFLVMPNNESFEGGVVTFGHRWPSAPVCVANGAGEHVVVNANRDTAEIILYSSTSQQAPIRILCSGGK